ncbi:uncharacterized protein B0I36DRAFT_352221 [Microdochium trichocladiopsis]|uniref:BHLH domain-containing protein n=1 Tax=Microdochium trichocladiopsis TaxID=1682393 RepID=A0A9P8Y0P4_9PEZI|nr:uncharacterized protein B0I36DRAFT_352221 [Microdochium trichocladiopsis]KAH7026346.1 hypothetical protein B0I36DRAFT_352221 [Microdochium trichocladiopsis]
MAQAGFNHFGGSHNAGGSINPNDLMGGGYGSSYSNNFSGNSSSNNIFTEDDLLDSLGSPTDGMYNNHGHNQNHEMGNVNEMNMGYSSGVYASHHNSGSLQIDQNHINGYSNTPDGDPIQSPFVHSFGGPQFRQMQNFGSSLQSPVSYSGSPLTGSDPNNDNGDSNYLNAKSRARLSQSMQRKPSNQRSPLTPKAASAMPTMDGQAFGAQPIRTANGHHEKSPSNQWMPTPNSLGSFPGSGFSSPMQHAMQNTQITDVLLKGGTSMPAKLGANGGQAGVSTQEMKRKRRRESHNLVERRRRDNINERIQDLSKLVPTHRLEDDKIRKLIQNGTPLSPSLTAVNSGPATSGLAAPGAKRATGVGNITTGLPLEDKDKGPNKGDILNGSVSWTRDLMWMLNLKLQQQQELIEMIIDLGGNVPFEFTEDEKRMQTELMETMAKNDVHSFSYSRRQGSGLRVPDHTDYRGDPLTAVTNGIEGISVSPDDNDAYDVGSDLVHDNLMWNDDNNNVFKEEDEYNLSNDMDMA